VSSTNGCKANVQYKSPITKVSPLTAAAKRGRGELIEDLIQRGAKPDSRDSKGRSALYYSCKNGNLETVKYLLGHSALHNDGSLLVAAKNCHTEVISMLLHAGADPNHLHPHKGKTALAHLCHKCQPRGTDWEELLRESIRLLFHGGSDPNIKFKKYSGKTALHLALENRACSFQIVEALLEYPEIAKYLDDDVFRFEDANGLIYSPTKYLELRCEGIPPVTKHEMIALFHGQNCEDRYYNPVGPQPNGYCGLPPHIKEFQQQFIRQNELAQNEIRNIELKHRRAIELGNELEAVEQSREERKQEKARRLLQLKHNQELAHTTEKNQMQLQHESSLGRQQQAIEEDKRRRELAHSGALSMQRQNEHQAILNMDRMRLADQENAARRNHSMAKELIQYETEQVKIRAKEMKAVAASARSGNIPNRLLTQGMSSTSLPSPD
jgi:ankyrin repeat protein